MTALTLEWYRNRVDMLERDNAALYETIELKNGEIGSLTYHISDLQKEIATLRTYVAEYSAALNDARSETLKEAQEHDESKASIRALHAEVEALREDTGRLDWLEQAVWQDQDECYMLVNDWRTIDGKRHPTGLRDAVDQAKALLARNGSAG